MLMKITDSFHYGNVQATVKDKVFQPSTALRHTVETVKVIMECKSVDDVSSAYPIQFKYSDGSPEHKTTWWT